MPNGEPLVGEVWETSDPTGRMIRGVVADTTTNVLTLVSFTGNRFRISPARLLTSWRFLQPAPNTALRCSRRGCERPGTLRFQRGSMPEWVCARHLPVGVQAALTTESIGSPTPPPRQAALAAAQAAPPVPMVITCLNCRSPDPVEDHRVTLPGRVSLWMCPRCSERWCVIYQLGLELPPEQQLFDDVNELRVRLSVENYTIRQIVVGPHIFRWFELNHGSRPNDAPGAPVVWFGGINVHQSSTFSTDHPQGTLLCVYLRGGPDFAAPPRRTAQVTLARDPDAPTPGVASIGPISLTGTTVLPDLADAMAIPRCNDIGDPVPFVSQGTRFVNRGTGDVVEVARIGTTTDGAESVVHFRRISDEMREPSSMLLLRDFELMFRPYAETAPRGVRREEHVVDVLKDEEWEHIESHDIVRIDSVDTKRSLVIVVVSKEKRKSIPMRDFVEAKYRKIVRKTAYARLMEDDE